MLLLSPETDNYPSWISDRERMTENKKKKKQKKKNFMINFHERMLSDLVITKKC